MSVDNHIEIIEKEKKFYAYRKQVGNENEGTLIFEADCLRGAITKIQDYVKIHYIEYGYDFILEN